MTRDEIKAKTQEKVKQLKDLADKLQIRLVAHNAMVQGNIIKPIVYFDDMEEYQVDPLPERQIRTPDAKTIREAVGRKVPDAVIGHVAESLLEAGEKTDVEDTSTQQ